MRHARTKWVRIFGLVAFVALGSFLAAGTSAQQKTVEERAAGPHEVNVELKNSTVAYIEGNHLVARLEDGTLEAIRVPEGTKFDVEGQQMPLSELRAGMVITETTIHTSKPMIVKTVEITDGKVFRIMGNTLIIRDKDNKLVHLTIPEWAKVTLHGEEVELQELRAGMTVTATFITEEPMTVIERQTKTSVRKPAPAPETTTKEEPVATQPPAPAQQTEAPPAAPPEQPVSELPKTASPLPLVGLAGLLSLAASLTLRKARKAF